MSGLVMVLSAFLAGLGFVIWGVLSLTSNVGYGLCLVGIGLLLTGAGGSVVMRGLGIYVQGTGGAILILVGAAVMAVSH
jgi:hypothetical protein